MKRKFREPREPTRDANLRDSQNLQVKEEMWPLDSGLCYSWIMFAELPTEYQSDTSYFKQITVPFLVLLSYPMIVSVGKFVRYTTPLSSSVNLLSFAIDIFA